MRIGGLGAGAGSPARDATDVATALTAAAAGLGHRPAVTVIGPDLRHEQGFVSLAGWAAKGAHLLRDELELAPGDVLGVDAPPSWPLAAVALAAWWAGVALGPVAPGRPAVVHEGRRDPGGTVLWLGDAVDGGPADPGWDGGEAWTAAVTPYPDRAPPPDAAPDLAATLDLDGRVTTQRALLASWCDDVGVLGLRRTPADAGAAGAGRSVTLGPVGALAVRPLVTGAPSVVVLGAWEAAALAAATDAERVARWA